MSKSRILLGTLILLAGLASIMFLNPFHQHSSIVARTNANELLSAWSDQSAALLQKFIEVQTIDPTFFTDGRSLLFSSVDTHRLAIRDVDLATGSIKTNSQAHTKFDHFYPVIFDDKQLSVYDDFGNQQYKIHGIDLPKPVSMDGSGRLFVSPDGSTLMVIGRVRGQGDVAHVYKLSSGRVVLVGSLPFNGLYGGHTFSRDGNFLLLASGSGLQLWDLLNNTNSYLAQDVAGEKSGPVFDMDENNIFFTALGASGFREIFKLPIRGHDQAIDFGKSAQLFYASSRDKNQLNIKGQKLYFIENVDTQYLLKSLDLKSKQTENLTSQGVVYRYQILESADSIIASYSDAKTPMSIVKLSISNPRVLTALAPIFRGDFDMGKHRVEQPLGLSPAWIFEPRVQSRGVVMTIHGGPDINVSPRWEAVIQLWLDMGFAVIAPNYPGSRGFGLDYMQSDEDTSVEDLVKWMDWVKNNYQGQPLFIEGMSYGGSLAQNLARRHPAGIHGLILRNTNLTLSTAEAADISILYLFGRNDRFVNANSAHSILQKWMSATSKDIYFREYAQEGHLLRGKDSVVDSLKTIHAFMMNGLSANSGTHN